MRFLSDVGAAIPALIAAFVAAAAISVLLTPVARTQARRFGMVDRPDHRRVNTRPVPRAGGVAVAIAFLVVGIAIVVFGSDLPVVDRRPGLETGDLLALLVGGALAAAIGLADDYFDLRARWQLLGQLALAGGAVALGIGIALVNDPFGGGVLRFDGLVLVAITVVWIVGMINSVNFIDGLDGLSSGICLIAALTLGVISLTTQIGQPLVALLCFALAGALLGFLRWNFHPAAVFAGTSGTMFMGYTLAVLSVLGSAKVAVALLVLGVPIIDTFWIIVRRVVARRSPFTPDRGHIHHRLLDLGLSHRQTVLLIYAICVALAAMSLVLSGQAQVYAFLGVFVGTGVLLLFLAWRGITHGSLDAETYDTEQPGPRGIS